MIWRIICWIYLFLIWQSELRGDCCSTAQVQCSDCFEYPLKFLLKSSYQKCLYIYIYNCQIFLSPKKSRNEKFQNKKYHLGNFNSPLPLQPPPWAGPRVKHYCWRCSFWLLEVVRHLSPSLYFSWFLSVCGKYLLQLIFISSWILFFLCFCVC